MVDWFGLFLTLLIVCFIILIVWGKAQGDTVIGILEEIRDFIKSS